MNKFLKKIIYTGLFLIPLIPLLVTKSFFFPFITGKNFVFRIIVGIIVGAWAILILNNREYRPKFSCILGSLISFVVVMVLATIFGANPEKSFWSNFERMEGLVTLIHLLGYFLVLGSMLNTEKLWNRLLKTTVGVSVVVGLYGIFQLAGFLKINQGGARVDATFGNATYLAIYIMFHIFITFLLIYKRTQEDGNRKFFKDWINYIYTLIIILQIVILYYTATRGTILGFIIGLFIMLILLLIFEKQNKILRKISAYTLISFVVLASLFFIFKDSNFVKSSATLSRMASISIEEASVSRIPVWNMAIEGFKEKPILGWGQESFNYVFNKNYNPKMYAQEQWFDRAHNVFLDWLVAGGALGLLSYLALFIFGIYYIWKNNLSVDGKEQQSFSIIERSILTGLFVGYFVHNIFVFDNIISYIFFVFILGYIHYNNTRFKERKNKLKSIQSELSKNISIIVIVALTIFAVYFFNVKGMLSNETLINAMKERAVGNFNSSIDFYKKALAYDTYGRREIRENLVQTASAIAIINIDINTKQRFFNLAKEEILKQIEEDPQNARYEVFAGGLFGRYKDYDNAIFHLKRALELSPNKQSIMFELGSNYINKGEEKKALEILKKAFEIEPSYQDARLIYAVAAIYVGDKKLAEELLIPVWGTIFVPDDRILKAYFDTGQKNEAIKVIENKIKTDPDFKVQGEEIIKEIRDGRI